MAILLSTEDSFDDTNTQQRDAEYASSLEDILDGKPFIRPEVLAAARDEVREINENGPRRFTTKTSEEILSPPESIQATDLLVKT
jgi:hypothetical protein